MLIIAFALLGSATPTAIDAERAFARDALVNGQWTAFRAYAAPSAVMFTPQTVWARDFLKTKKDPPEPLRWSPNQSYVSCDGLIAVNSGPWRNAGGRQFGYFTTVWQQEQRQWRWVYDGGDTLKKPIAALKKPVVRKASCRGRAPGPPLMSPPSEKRGPGGKVPDDFGVGISADRTLGWDWRVGEKGARHFRTFLWNGRNYALVLDQSIAAR